MKRANQAGSIGAFVVVGADQQSGRGEARSEVKTEDVKPESSSSNNSSQQSTQTDKGLPKTGPESLVFSALGVGILAFLTVAYQKSRYLV